MPLGIALDKNPGLRGLSAFEILRRIIGKAILDPIGCDVQKACGPLQLCAGQSAGVEATVHAMRMLFEDDEADGVFLIDAENAFNKINRVAALWNCQFVCPSLKYGLINFYRSPARIFITSDGKFAEFSSQEGTTQGCPLAMAMFAIALKPLHDELRSLCKQAWFADDGTGCDTFLKMRNMYDALLKRGPLYGYFMQPKKCILIVKEGKRKNSLARQES